MSTLNSRQVPGRSASMTPTRSTWRRTLLLPVLIASVAIFDVARADVSLDPIQAPDLPAQRTFVHPYKFDLDPVVVFPAVGADELETFHLSREAAREMDGPEMIGKLRRLASPISFDSSRSGAENAAMGFAVENVGTDIIVSFIVEVADKFESRVFLENIQGGEDAVFSVVSPEGVSRELKYPGDGTHTALLPDVPSEQSMIAIKLPALRVQQQPFKFDIAGINQILVGDPPETCKGSGGRWTACAISAACVAESIAARSIARLNWLSGGSYWLCTGTLVNSRNFYLPYVLTANHCLNTQAEASTLQAQFDYLPGSCGGSVPPTTSLPTVYGSQLVRTNTSNDMTFLRLYEYPSGGRSYLGWSTANMVAGQVHKRLSHPAGSHMRFSQGVLSGGLSCAGLPASHYWYTQNNQGSTAGGSSGSAIYRDDGIIVGQLYGTCSVAGSEACSYSTYRQVDGRFSITYPLIEPWLEQPFVAIGLNAPLTGQASAVAPLSMRYYRFTPATFMGGSFRVRIYGNATNADLYVGRSPRLPMTTEWECRSVGSASEKSCVLSQWGQYYIGVNARAPYSNLSIEVTRIPDPIFDHDFGLGGPVFELPLDDFAVEPIAQSGVEVTRFAPVFDSHTIKGLRFKGTVSGVSGAPNYASDLRMKVTTPAGQVFDVGGFANAVNSWGFQTPFPYEDGTYTSTRFVDANGVPIFGPLGTASFGIWTFRFSHDYGGGSAMQWSNVSITLIGDN